MKTPTSYRHTLVALALTALAGFAACGDDQDPAGAEDLLTRLKDAKYQGWARAPGYSDRRASSAPHGDEVEIFVNDVVEAALQESGLEEWPVGSIVAKDGYDDGSHSLIAAMEKREDGWYWAEWDAESGESIYSGKPGTCIDCHASGADYVRAFDLP